MDIEGFLLGSGFALLIVLLGWANQMTSKGKETKELETMFLKKVKLKSGTYKKIIDGAGSTGDSLSALVDFLFTRKEKHIELFDKINTIRKDLVRLEKKYNSRFWILLSMTVLLIGTGIIGIFIPQKYKTWMLIPNLLLIVIVIFNLIQVHLIERRYSQCIYETMEKL